MNDKSFCMQNQTHTLILPTADCPTCLHTSAGSCMLTNNSSKCRLKNVPKADKFNKVLFLAVVNSLTFLGTHFQQELYTITTEVSKNHAHYTIHQVMHVCPTL